MRKQLIFAVLASLALVSCKAEAEPVKEPETTTENVVVAEENDVLSFAHSADAVYLVSWNGTDIDISEDVISCTGTELILNSNALTKFGFEKFEREPVNTRFDEEVENETVAGNTFREYADSDGNLAQFEMQTKKVFYKGKTYSVSKPFAEIAGTEDFEMPSDALKILGIGMIEYEREDKKLKLILK